MTDKWQGRRNRRGGGGADPQYLERGREYGFAPQYLALILQNGAKEAWFEPIFC